MLYSSKTKTKTVSIRSKPLILSNMMAAQNVNVKREMVANASEAPTKRIF